jgi:hypothetical protein
VPGAQSADQNIHTLRVGPLFDRVERHTDAALLSRSGSVEDERLVGWQLTIACGRVGIGERQRTRRMKGVVLGRRAHIVEEGLAAIEQSRGLRWCDALHILCSEGRGWCHRRE